MPKTQAEVAVEIKKRGVTQDRQLAPYGNCLEAVIATMLDIPLTDVPDLRAAAEAKGVEGEDLKKIMVWRKSALRRWLAEQHGLLWIEAAGEAPHPYPEWDAEPLVWIASGMSPRGLRHAVLYVNGELAWDPHPAREGLTGIDAWGVFVPLGDKE